MKGIVQLYSGNGKGKTTASVGLALRALSRGMRVVYAQFMKAPAGGELDELAGLGAVVIRFSEVRSPLFNPGADEAEIRRAALDALDAIAGRLPEEGLLVMDEFCAVLAGGFVTREEAMTFIDGRPAGVELVITGRGAPEWLIERADLVTEMREVKHPYDSGLEARRGIEF